MNKWIYIAGMVLCLAGCQAEMQNKVHGRYVPERKDDFAWENEYAAFRMYGPALADENPSNGVDLWLKNSPALVIDTMYARELKDGRPYHINYDGNLDCYKVGHTAGAGGLVVIVEDKLYIGGPYSTWEILEQTPERFRFRLHYDSLLVQDEQLQADVTVTAEAGKMLNKAEVVLKSIRGNDVQSIKDRRLFVGGGIYMHDTIDNYIIYRENGAVAYAENALSDKHAAQLNYEYNGSTSQGRDYVAVVLPGATKLQPIEGTLVSVRPYQLGDTLTYWFGACWSEWRDGEKAFETDEAWFDAVEKL